jgi:hypothetical protein
MDVGHALEYLRSNHRSVIITRKRDGGLAPGPDQHA